MQKHAEIVGSIPEIKADPESLEWRVIARLVAEKGAHDAQLTAAALAASEQREEDDEAAAWARMHDTAVADNERRDADATAAAERQARRQWLDDHLAEIDRGVEVTRTDAETRRRRLDAEAQWDRLHDDAPAENARIDADADAEWERVRQTALVDAFARRVSDDEWDRMHDGAHEENDLFDRGVEIEETMAETEAIRDTARRTALDTSRRNRGLIELLERNETLIRGIDPEAARTMGLQAEEHRDDRPASERYECAFAVSERDVTDRREDVRGRIRAMDNCELGRRIEDGEAWITLLDEPHEQEDRRQLELGNSLLRRQATARGYDLETGTHDPSKATQPEMARLHTDQLPETIRFLRGVRVHVHSR